MAKVFQQFAYSGFEALTKRAARYLYRRTIRKLLPTIAEVKYSGIPISRERKFGDAKLPDFLAPHPLEASQTMSKLSLTPRDHKFVSAIE